jgi:hypothetical protein
MEKFVLNKVSNVLRKSIRYCFLLSVFYFIGCGSVSDDDPSNIVMAWVGKTITFPSNIPCARLGEETPCQSVATKYKVLLYTDSAGCVSCDLRIDAWKTLIAESKDKIPGQMSFYFYFNPRAGERLSDLFKKENFKEQVYIDSDDLLNKRNRFPDKMPYQCFLLNEKDEVLLVGNPTLNPNIHKMYIDLMAGKFIPGQKSNQN